MTGESALLRQLERFYEDVDALYAATSCPATSECCRFARTGREPYVTSLEVALIARAIERRSGAKADRPEPPHVPRPGLPVLSDERACPLLTRDGRCSIYAARPLGCRTFFCERKTELGAGVKHKELVALVSRLKSLAEQHVFGGDEGRPLSRALAVRGGRLNKSGQAASNGASSPARKATPKRDRQKSSR